KFSCLLGSRSLPHAEHTRRFPADRSRQGNSSVNQNRSHPERRLELLQQIRLAVEGNSQNAKVGGGACCGILHAGNSRIGPGAFGNLQSRLLGATTIARSDDDRFPSLGPAQGETLSLRPCSS